MAFPSMPATLDSVAGAMQAKATMAPGRAWVLAMLAGAYIALAAFGSTVASCNLSASPDTYGLGRCVAGLLFPIGLIMVVVGGGELFTGNCMMPEAVRRGLISLPAMLRSWGLVYAGNFAGSIIVALMLWLGGAFLGGSGQVAAAVIKTAAAKASLGIFQEFFLGIFCNWLVCVAVWLAARAESAPGKAIVIFFPIWLFVTSGYEHSVANMYYLSAGLLAACDTASLTLSGLAPSILDALGISALARNLLFVTLGNIAGGAVFVSGAYWLACGNKKSG